MHDSDTVGRRDFELRELRGAQRGCLALSHDCSSAACAGSAMRGRCSAPWPAISSFGQSPEVTSGSGWGERLSMLRRDHVRRSIRAERPPPAAVTAN